MQPARLYFNPAWPNLILWCSGLWHFNQLTDSFDWFTTILESFQSAWVAGGVPQGSALTPLLFTIFSFRPTWWKFWETCVFQLSSSIEQLWISSGVVCFVLFLFFDLLTRKPAENDSLLQCWCESNMSWKGLSSSAILHYSLPRRPSQYIPALLA